MERRRVKGNTRTALLVHSPSLSWRKEREKGRNKDRDRDVAYTNLGSNMSPSLDGQ